MDDLRGGSRVAGVGRVTFLSCLCHSHVVGEESVLDDSAGDHDLDELLKVSS